LFSKLLSTSGTLASEELARGFGGDISLEKA